MTQIMKTTGDWVVIIFILSGAVISLFGSIGILRFPDYYNRNHASSKTTTLGVLLTLLGAFLYFLFETGSSDWRLILAAIFLFLASPIGSHMLARSAYRSGVPMWEHSVHDVLYDYVHAEELEAQKEQQEGQTKEAVET